MKKILNPLLLFSYGSLTLEKEKRKQNDEWTERA